MTVLLREYSNEIAQSGVSRREMRRRVLALLDKQHESRGEMPPIERFEVIALLRVFAAEAIKDGRDKYEDMKAFLHQAYLVRLPLGRHREPVRTWSGILLGHRPPP